MPSTLCSCVLVIQDGTVTPSLYDPTCQAPHRYDLEYVLAEMDAEL